MLFRFISESVRRAPRRKALIIAAIAMGSAVATAMLGVMLDIGDKINHELRNAGANILVTPRIGYIAEADVPKVKAIFWALAILGSSPSLSARDAGLPVEGVRFRDIQSVNPAWLVPMGRWASDGIDECMAGAAIARRNHWKPGSTVNVLGAPFKMTGIISAGDDNDDRIFVPLARMQALTGRTGEVDRIEVAALTKPEDDFARKNPKSMTQAEEGTNDGVARTTPPFQSPM